MEDEPDIVARLRIWSDNAKEQNATDIVVGLCEAAAEIEGLRARVIELEEKLSDAYAFIDQHESGLRALLQKVIAEEARKN